MLTVRIAIDGAQSTGKTTLFELLRLAFSGDLAFIPEAARVLAPEFGVQRAEDWPQLLSDKTRLQKFFDAEEEWQLKQQIASSAFVVDSSLMLTWAYRRHFQCSEPAHPDLAGHYDLVLYCPLRHPSHNDGFRFVVGRTSIDSHYKRIAQSVFVGKLVELPESPSLRVSVAEQAIKSLLGSTDSQVPRVNDGK